MLKSLIVVAVLMGLSGCNWFDRTSPTEKRKFEKAEPLAQNEEAGVYRCTKCGALLFSSEKKIDHTHSQWPLFSEAEPGAVRSPATAMTAQDTGNIVCSKCNLQIGFRCQVDSEHPTGAPAQGPYLCAFSSAMKFEPRPQK